jgi:hypothetical protein
MVAALAAVMAVAGDLALPAHAQTAMTHSRHINPALRRMPRPLPPVERTLYPMLNQTKMVAFTRAPYWQVGLLDSELSSHCSRGHFKQRIYQHRYFGHVGPIGKANLGISHTGYNLHDPYGFAEPSTYYYFLDSGDSRCRVFIWKASWDGNGELMGLMAERFSQGLPAVAQDILPALDLETARKTKTIRRQRLRYQRRE